jgi:hypothetical protein
MVIRQIKSKPSWAYHKSRMDRSGLKPQTVLRSTGKKRRSGKKLIAYFHFIRRGPHRKRRLHFFYCCKCIRCRCKFSTEQLPSNDKVIHRHTYWWEGFMKSAAEMGSGAMIYIPTFINIDSPIQKLITVNTRTGQHADGRYPLLLFFFQNKESRLKLPDSDGLN